MRTGPDGKRGDLPQGRNRAFIAFDRDDTGSAQRQQCAGQSARSRSDFQNGCSRQRLSGAGDAGGEVEVEQEILAERFSRDDAVPANDVA
jgi:hypothetical protein